jgi:hypothetical protein
MFRLLRVIIRPSTELIQDYLTTSALWDPVVLTIYAILAVFYVALYAPSLVQGIHMPASAYLRGLPASCFDSGFHNSTRIFWL